MTTLIKLAKKLKSGRDEIPPSTLDLLILKTISVSGRLQRYEIAECIQRASGEVFRVEEGSLYPALQRMLCQGLCHG